MTTHEKIAARAATLATAWAAALDKWKEANKALHAWPGPDDIPAPP